VLGKGTLLALLMFAAIFRCCLPLRVVVDLVIPGRECWGVLVSQWCGMWRRKRVKKVKDGALFLLCFFYISHDTKSGKSLPTHAYKHKNKPYPHHWHKDTTDGETVGEKKVSKSYDKTVSTENGLLLRKSSSFPSSTLHVGAVFAP
jgi:hypothetical protein